MNCKIQNELKKIMKNNDASYIKLVEELSKIGNQDFTGSDKYMSDEEFNKYKKFSESGNQELELAVKSATWTQSFAYGMQTMRAMFENIDFSKSFRIIVDYDPEQPRTVIKRYLTKEAHESYSHLIREMTKDSQIPQKMQHKNSD